VYRSGGAPNASNTGKYYLALEMEALMRARLKNPAVTIPDAMQAIQALNAATRQSGVPPKTLDLIHLRASPIIGRRRSSPERARRLARLFSCRRPPG